LNSFVNCWVFFFLSISLFDQLMLFTHVVFYLAFSPYFFILLFFFISGLFIKLIFFYFHPLTLKYYFFSIFVLISNLIPIILILNPWYDFCCKMFFSLISPLNESMSFSPWFFCWTYGFCSFILLIFLGDFC
jgi:hypothetical protein